MKIVARVLPLLLALIFLATGVNWIVNPAQAAANLGMELLTGLGASTQIGDISAFFVSASVLIGIGSLPGRSEWLYAPALLVGTAALMRTLAWATGNAPFGASFIGPEVVMAGVLVAAARIRAGEPAPN